MSSPLQRAVAQVSLVSGATTAVNGLNYLYHIVMAPVLGPAAYGEFATLVGILTLLLVPATVVQMVVAQRVARHRALHSNLELAVVFRSVFKPLLAYAVLVVLALALLGGFVTIPLGLTRTTTIIVLASVFLLSLMSRLTLGALTGLERFRALSFVTVGSVIARIVSGVLLVAGGAGAIGALGASGFAGISFLVAGVLLVPAFFRLHRGQAQTTAELSRFPLGTLVECCRSPAL